MDLGIKGHVAVVTGAGRGIGARTARLLAEEGARVVVWDRDQGPADTVAGEIVAAGGEAMAVTGSVSEAAEVDTAARAVLGRFGTIHILVNNAGFAHIVTAIETTDRQWTEMVDVHMKGAFHCVRAMAPAMTAQNYGRIINMSSLSVLGANRMAAYAAAKAGLLGLTRALMVELGPRQDYGERDPAGLYPDGARQEQSRVCDSGRAFPARAGDSDRWSSGGCGECGSFLRFGQNRIRHRRVSFRNRRHESALVEISPRPRPAAWYGRCRAH